jgi:hypothetical protein
MISYPQGWQACEHCDYEAGFRRGPRPRESVCSRQRKRESEHLPLGGGGGDLRCASNSKGTSSDKILTQRNKYVCVQLTCNEQLQLQYYITVNYSNATFLKL